MDAIVIVDYDSRWPHWFEQESVYLRAILTRDLVLRIEHIGSTAIPGMAAKPIIDMLVEISSFDRAKAIAIPKLQAEGYDYIWRSDRPPGHMMFIKRSGPKGPRTHHLHMAPSGHKLWDRLYFRDYLRADPEEAQRYALLKRDLANRFPIDREAYTNGKSAYVELITAKAQGIVGRE
ncbi:MAG: GrpB family protein [Leptolyngbyaceae cyanobacterium MO_188.B28]|nr:GrpB family protein [Leptolyngbyaceae cyanobacterium MO_188.B28]